MNLFVIQLITQLKSCCSTFRSEDGQSIVDYVLTIALVAVAVVGALSQVNASVSGVFTGMLSALVRNVGS